MTNLEREIRQGEFKSQYQKVLINLIYTSNQVISKMSDVFKDYDITRQQYNVLRILRGQYPEPVTLNLIKERMLDKMSDASRIAVRLEKKGLIERRQNTADRRASDITISQKGLQLLEKMDFVVAKFEDYFSNLSEEEARKLNLLLDRIRD